MPQMSCDCLGLLLLTPEEPIVTALETLYKGTQKPVAFVDESFELEEEWTFYIVAASIIMPHRLDTVREALLDCNGRRPLHAGPMAHLGDVLTLQAATEVIANEQDGLDIVVCSPIADDDLHADRARARALGHLAVTLQHAFATDVFVIDHRALEPLNALDRRTFSDLRRGGLLTRETRVHHCRPSEEPLLGLADALAWSYRQDYLNKNTLWFDPLRDQTVIQILT